MSAIVVITGLGGDEFFLAHRELVTEERKARKFRSDAAAEEAAKAHLDAFPAIIKRHMAYRVEPRA